MTKTRKTKDRPKMKPINVSISEAAFAKIKEKIKANRGVGTPATICRGLIYESLDISD
jgi:hypothetical protein